jgi:hypothetical protein
MQSGERSDEEEVDVLIGAGGVGLGGVDCLHCEWDAIVDECIVVNTAFAARKTSIDFSTHLFFSEIPHCATHHKSSTNPHSPNMSQIFHPNHSTPPTIPALPQRPLWTSAGVLSTESISALSTIEVVINVWNQWAARMEDVFRQMNAQSDRLDVPVEDYIGWISRFSNHPPRPTLSPAEESRDRSMGVPHIALMRAHSRWEGFADELADTYSVMALELSSYKLRTGGEGEVIECDDGVLDFSKISLAAGTSTLTQVKAVFGAMLGPGRSFHRVGGGSEGRQMALLNDNVWHADGQVGDRSSNEQPGGQSDSHLEERSRREWAVGFLDTLREINREMAEEEYRDLNLQGLDIEDRDLEG